MSRKNGLIALVVLCIGGLGVASLAFGATKKRKSSPPRGVVRIAACPATPETRDDVRPLPVPSKALLAAFGVLRRDRKDRDILPARAAAALRDQGASFDPATARLLRTDRSGAKAWIVPVVDVHVLDGGSACDAFALPRGRGVQTLPALPAPAYRGGGARTLPANPVPVPPGTKLKRVPGRFVPAKPQRIPAANRTLAKRRAEVRRIVALTRHSKAIVRAGKSGAPVRVEAARLRKTVATRARQQRALRRLRPAIAYATAAVPDDVSPQEGVAVVALDGAPAGGGGALDDLTRGRAAPAVRPCAGISQRLTSVSGVVPDGVGEAFLTSPDGTSVKADVADNAYSFLVAPLSSPEARYVVWLKDGFPHVQVLPPISMGGPCQEDLKGAVDVTPGILNAASLFTRAPLARAIRVPTLPSVQRVPRITKILPALPQRVPRPRRPQVYTTPATAVPAPAVTTAAPPARPARPVPTVAAPAPSVRPVPTVTTPAPEPRP